MRVCEIFDSVQGEGRSKRDGLVKRRDYRIEGVDWETVKRMILEGLSAEQIGCKVGLCGTTIRKYTKVKFPHLVETLRGNGLMRKRNSARKVDQGMVNEMVRYSELGYGVDLIGKKLGVDGVTVARHLKEALGEEVYSVIHSRERFSGRWTRRYFGFQVTKKDKFELVDVKVTDAFVAGFLEGDGTIQHFYCKNQRGRGTHFKPMVMFVNTRKSVLEAIREYFGAGWLYERKDGMFILEFSNKKSVRPVAIVLANQYLSEHRRRQLEPVLAKLGIEPHYKRHVDLDWVKGFFLAEGSLSYDKRSYVIAVGVHETYTFPTACMTNTCRETLEVVQDFLRSIGIKTYLCSYRRYPCFVLRIANLFYNKFEEVMSNKSDRDFR